ncbi:MAG: NAD(P)-dependent alcohol dehydrogenase [Actinomycetes bacterium]|nr:NAD(P)-dependent alcohol dehydrogenase [Actinomycetes bacterium]MDX5379730.1 NAD(P)-dependent alcohol dehydrogenase [Actinomycetes bacterium]MDX5398131.1 NAD(P)-dependent alcohol dehydrogenase [Actinomycetes bacterium]MDX5449427.1 NAD(P)-dependent alcohol dehydrogenase [Actinomycetes bacterium]
MQHRTENRTTTTPLTTGRMRAVVQETYGGPENLRVTEIERPTPGPGEVLVEVVAAGVDRGVWHLMTGRPYVMRIMGFGLRRPRTRVPGLDVAGRVAAVGAGVRRFEVGDEVFGIASGSFAQYAIATEAKLAARPAGTSHAEAAAATISGITALQALTDAGRLEAGQHVLVIGASGGVGSHAVQLAKALGATVTGVASGRKADLVRDLGADHVIDHETTDYLDGRTRYDLIVDTGGRNPLRRLRRALTSTGTLVIDGGEGGGRWTGGAGRQLRAVMLSPFVSQRLTSLLSTESTDAIERLARHLAAGHVRPAVGRRYPLEQAGDAVADLAAGHARGKSVITVHPEN